MCTRQGLNDLLRTASAPRWRFWVSTGKKTAARQRLIESGTQVVPWALEIWETNPPLRTCDIILEVLTAIGDDALSALWNSILETRSLATLGTRLFILAQFPQISQRCIPYLLLWACPIRYEKNGVTLTLGSAGLNATTLPIIEKLPPQLVGWYATAPDNEKDRVVRNAIFSLKKCARNGKEYLASFQDLLALSNWSHTYAFMDDVIGCVER